MTFLDGINAGLPFAQALAEGRPNLCHELTKEVLVLLFKKRLTIGQIALGFDVRTDFVVQQCRECGIRTGSVAPDETVARRKMTVLEGVQNGMELKRALEVCKSTPRTAATEGILEWLCREGFSEGEVALIFGVSAAVAKRWLNKLDVGVPEAHEPEQVKKNPEKMVAKVADLLVAGKSSGEIHHELGIKHPGAIAYIRLARKKLQVVPSVAIEDEPMTEPEEAASEDEVLSLGDFLDGLEWEGLERPSQAPGQVIKISGTRIYFPAELLPDAKFLQVGTSTDGLKVALRRVNVGRQVSKNHIWRSVNAIKIVKLYRGLLGNRTLYFEIIHAEDQLIVGKFI